MKIFASILLMALVLSSCIKYEDGPAFSFLTKEKRLTRAWQLTKVEYFIGQDSILVEGEVYPFFLDFEKDKSLSYKIEESGSLQEYSSSWNWHLGTWGITLDLAQGAMGNNGSRNYQIKRLSKKELWLNDRATGNNYYFEAY
jgi:hypothetical protein